MYNQSKIFIKYPHSIADRLTDFARKIFLSHPSSARELLTVFLNESRESNVQDFIIQRNAELALNIEPFSKKTKVNQVKKKWLNERE